MKDKYVKICGIQSLEEAMLCYNAGCTALGFLMALTHKAEDEISPEVARKIIKNLPSEIEKVMVTHSLNVNKITRIARITKISTIQIHGDMGEKSIIHLKSLLPGIPLIKAIHVDHDYEAVLTHTKRMSRIVDKLLLDSRTVDRLGGTGIVHDWSISEKVVRQATLPIILAGGLNPNNVSAAINRVNPYGVDVNSGVEDQDGRKEVSKVKAFIANSRENL